MAATFLLEPLDEKFDILRSYILQAYRPEWLAEALAKEIQK